MPVTPQFSGLTKFPLSQLKHTLTATLHRTARPLSFDPVNLVTLFLACDFASAKHELCVR